MSSQDFLLFKFKKYIFSNILNAKVNVVWFNIEESQSIKRGITFTKNVVPPKTAIQKVSTLGP